MFGKLLLIILTSALTAAALLAMRQQRLDLAHEASQVHRRISEHDRSLWMLQERIAESCRADELRAIMDRVHDQWVPIEPAAPELVQVVDGDAADAATIDTNIDEPVLDENDEPA